MNAAVRVEKFFLSFILSQQQFLHYISRQISDTDDDMIMSKIRDPNRLCANHVDGLLRVKMLSRAMRGYTPAERATTSVLFNLPRLLSLDLP